MNRINLTQYGFIRTPQNDFSDDGIRFTTYKVGNIRVTKASYQQDVFISATINRADLDYEVYSNLPHYQNLSRLNGVNKMFVEKDDLIQLYNDCIAYENEYNERLKAIKIK